MKRIKRALPIVLLLLLLVSAGANYILFSAAKKYYYDLQSVRFNPLGLESYRELPPEKGDLPRVVFYGDSRAFQWPAPESNQFEFLNRGIGAQTSNQILLRYDEHVTPLEPDVLLVQMCINELKTVPIFPDRRKGILRSCQQNIQTVIENAEAVEAKVILTTVFPAGEVSLRRRFLWSPDVDVVIKEINQFISEQASDDVIVFDAYTLLADETGHTDPEYAFDLLHLNTAGYEMLNQELIHILDSIVDN